MKIEKTVDVTVDVEVSVSLEDIVSAIWESRESLSEVLRGVNNCHSFLKAIPDELLATLNEAQRKTIFDAMTVQVARFRPTVSDDA